jgi:hypothetical protein
MNQEATNQVPEEEPAAPETAPDVEATAPESSEEWKGFVDEFDSDDVEEEAEAQPPIAAEKPGKPSDDDGAAVKDKATEPAVEEKPQEPIEEVVEEAKAPETPSEAEAPQAKEQSPELSADQKAKMREDALLALSEQYKLQESEDLDFETNLTQELPKLAANLHLTVYEQVVQSVMSQLPQVVGSLMETRQTAQSKEQEFFREYEDLSPYKEQVTQVAMMWSQMNSGKKMSAKERSAEIARFARAALGIAPGASAAVEPEPAPIASITTPQAPPVQATYAQANRNLSPWEQMAIEMENDPD